MLNVALTGNIASGKSTVARLFAEWGATVIDADEIVRTLQRPGTPELAAIAERFGPGVISSDGSLDRVALRRLAFDDPEARLALNGIMHPAVARERARRLAAARAHGASVVVSDIPLLFEVMDPAGFDAVVLVDAPVDVRRGRLMKHRQLDRAAADAMMAAQLPSEGKRSRSTYVIDNDGDFDQLRQRAETVWKTLATAARRTS
jgi:dephospho-CoA kinase